MRCEQHIVCCALWFAGCALAANSSFTYPSADIESASAQLVRQVEFLLFGRIILAVSGDEFVGIGSARRIDTLCLNELIYSSPEDGLVEDSRFGCGVVGRGVRL